MRDNTGRIYTHYEYWEDYKNGLYKSQTESIDRIKLSMKVLSNPNLCKLSMEKVIKEWPVSTAVNLSIPGCQRPWLGRAACCIKYGISENITRIAWWKLALEKQDSANAIADTIINAWRKNFLKSQVDMFNE